MIDYKEILLKELKEKEANNEFQTRIAGDTTTFRYPHLNHLSSYFRYDSRLKAFILDRLNNKLLSEITINDITTYELLNPEAKRLHLYDFFGFKATDEEKYNAYSSVKKDYLDNKRNGFWKYPCQIKLINIKDIKIRDEFEHLRDFINKSKDSSIIFYLFNDVDFMFQFGSTLKGTNIVITDDNKANFYQELFHIIYHLEETIPGVDNDNLNIEEIWGNADSLYLKQLLEGRMSRRIRNNTSPHDVKFLDYVFLRAYIGTAFAEPNEELCFHSAFSLIEPTIKLLIACLKGDIKNKNRIIIDAICYDKTTELKESFNQVFGDGAYEKVFYDFSLFHRLETIKALCNEKGINYDAVLNIMFSNEHLVPTVIDSDIVRYIWENKEVNQDKDFIIDLIENKSKIAQEKGTRINLNNINEIDKSKGLK